MESAVVLGTPRLGPGGAAVLPKLVPRECAPPEAAGIFRPTKTALNRGAHNSMKGRAGAVREQSGITLLRGD